MPETDGTSGQVMTTNGAGQVTFQDPATGGGTLDEAYDFGGAGAGRTITADNGAVEISGNGPTSLSVNTTNSFTPSGITNTLTSASLTQNALENILNGVTTGSGVANMTAIRNTIQLDASSAFPLGRTYGMVNSFENASGYIAYGINNSFNVTSSFTDYTIGMRNTLGSTTNEAIGVRKTGWTGLQVSQSQ